MQELILQKYVPALIPNHCALEVNYSCMASAGLPVSLSFIGGSITEGGGVPFHDRAPLSFTGKVTNWVRDTYPNTSIRVQNAGVGGVTSLYYAQCVDMFVPDEDVDLVFVDFTLNDRASGIMGKSPEPDTPDRYAVCAYRLLFSALCTAHLLVAILCRMKRVCKCMAEMICTWLMHMAEMICTWRMHLAEMICTWLRWFAHEPITNVLLAHDH